MLAWDGPGTNLPPGFATLRLETNFLECKATERVPDAERPTAGRCLDHPVHLLCRALRTAPVSYERFELTAARRCHPLHVIGGGNMYVGDRRTSVYSKLQRFDSIVGLAAAMQRYAAEESLTVHVLPDEQCIIVHRIGDWAPGGNPGVQ